ncbi:hypothetical protein F5Y00DRAFT_264744 [Daldinia vernicosa]|uniref:uncharacterized protein n=1 Tax=Daldinia vernicosa TaxID=114800 RepID=UPI00200721B3|nr:uncharacterized protein F5Y00DRAFT_264744 [Daldinia vernicosa]KAI0846200.1 hypothetical protein F5Y00DRAFT_264744 [Daldinia vernicosa]
MSSRLTRSSAHGLRRQASGPRDEEDDVDMGGPAPVSDDTDPFSEDDEDMDVDSEEDEEEMDVDSEEGEEEEDELTDSSLPDPDSEKEDEGKKRKGGGKATNEENIEAITKAYAALPAELRTLARDGPARVQRTAKKSRAYIAKHKGQLESMEDLYSLMPTDEVQIGEVWTQALEDEFQQGLAQDPYLAYIDGSTLPKSNERYIPMWKKICRLRRVFPPNVISPLNYLEYGATARVELPDGTTRPDPVWSSSFCERLTRLVLGGPWGDDMEQLATFVRYASACRMDDRRPIPLFVLNNEGSSFVRQICEKFMHNRDPGKTIPRAHQDARRAVRSSGHKLPWESQMMRSIEKLAFERSEQLPRDEDEDEDEYRIYSVTTEDLRMVERAVSNCKDLGRPLFASVRDTCRIVSHGRSFDYPKTYEHVKILQKRIYVEEKRGLEKRRLEQILPVDSPVSSPV